MPFGMGPLELMPVGMGLLELMPIGMGSFSAYAYWHGFRLT